MPRTTPMSMLMLVCTAACARNVVTPVSENRSSQPRPTLVLVYDPAATEAEVIANRSLIARGQAGDEARDERDDIGTQAAGAFAAEVVAGVRQLGVRAERARRTTPVPENAVLVVSEFVHVDEGNLAKRLVIGFGSGASRVDARVQVYYSGGGRRTKLLEFETHSDSGKMPGGAATMGAGAVVTGGVTATTVVADAAVGGVKMYRSAVERLAAKGAEQATNYLSEYFGTHGWIAADHVTAAKQ